MKISLSLMICFLLNNLCYSQIDYSKQGVNAAWECSEAEEEAWVKLDPIDLEDKVIEQLKLKSNKIASEFITQKELPNSLNETLIIIPEIENDISEEEEEIYYELTSHILIVNSVTGKINYHHTESAKENGWISDAIAISQITIDAKEYELTKDEVAFGIKVDFRNNSQANPYSYTDLSLYIKEGQLLKKVLDNLVIEEHSGEVNVNIKDCYASLKAEKNEMTILDSNTNGYYDVQIENSISNTVFEFNSQGDCEEEEKSRVEKTSIWKYDKTRYQ